MQQQTHQQNFNTVRNIFQLIIIKCLETAMQIARVHLHKTDLVLAMKVFVQQLKHQFLVLFMDVKIFEMSFCSFSDTAYLRDEFLAVAAATINSD